MNKQEILQLINANPAFHLAAVEGDQPKVRAMFLFSADENGIVFHTGTMKDVYQQIEKNPKVEMCFNDAKNGVQVRVTGTLEQISDHAFKDKVSDHPSRVFLRKMRDGGVFKDFYNELTVYKLAHGSATWWTMQENLAPKSPVIL